MNLSKLLYAYLCISLCTAQTALARISISTSSIATTERSLPHEEGGRYYNYPGEQAFREHALPSLKSWYEWAVNRQEFVTNDINEWKYYHTPLTRSIYPTIHWIGHSSFLLQINGFNILIDPVFYDIPVTGKRSVPAGISPERLPHIDMVLITHDHRDHLDEASIKQLRQFDPVVCVPEGLKTWFKKRGFSQVVESSWWNQHICAQNGKKITLTFVPAMHWSQRKMFDTNKTLWGGWVIQNETKTIYVAGDTAFAPKFFEDIAHAFDHIDIALLPIGPCEPRQTFKDAHMDARQACEAFMQLNAECMIPMHWGTFKIGTDTFDAPVQAMLQWWEQHPEVTAGRTHKVLRFGERVTFQS